MVVHEGSGVAEVPEAASEAALSCPRCASPCEGASYCPACGVALAGTRRGGDRRVVTVLFADLCGFTSLCERMDPERLTDLVNAFFEELSRPIAQFGGVVDKYIGDAIMALFGAPTAHEDDPERAVWAAYEMQRVAREYAERTGVGLALRVGINTGLVVAGMVGTRLKRDYTVMGDAVNLAQRMEQHARPGTVLVAPETHRLVRGRFAFNAMAPLTVKGKRAPVPAYELIGPTPSETRGDRLELVGRAVELEVLRS